MFFTFGQGETEKVFSLKPPAEKSILAAVADSILEFCSLEVHFAF